MSCQRVVCFRFKTEVTPEQRQEMVAAFRTLARQIPSIRSYRDGATLPGDNGSTPGWDSFHYLTFDTPMEIDTYYRHPAHEQFVEQFSPLWQDVLVINASVDETQVRYTNPTS